MKPLIAKHLIAILLANNFVLARIRGSHHIYSHQITGQFVSVPIHGKNQPIHLGTFLAIVKQSRLPRELFEK